MITLWRIFAASWKHLGRNAWIALATVFVFAMALLSVDVLLAANALLDRTIVSLEDRIDLAVSFKPGAADAIVQQARFALASLPQVKDVAYVSADEVLRRFRERHQGEGKMLEALDEVGQNPFGAQLVVRAHRVDDYPFLLNAIQNPQYKDAIEQPSYDDHRVAIDRVRELSRQLRVAGAILVALFALFGMLIAFNAIRVAVYTHREEIGIMRLVGASSVYIRTPFILEAAWLSLAALVLSAAVTVGALSWMEPAATRLLGMPGGLMDYFIAHAPSVIGLEFGGLAALSMLVSWVAAGRYIRR